jgi:hypothetical protein
MLAPDYQLILNKQILTLKNQLIAEPVFANTNHYKNTVTDAGKNVKTASAVIREPLISAKE